MFRPSHLLVVPSQKGKVTFVDGHVETWRYADFRQNKNNIFAEDDQL